MNKRKVDKWLNVALDALNDTQNCKICSKDGKIEEGFRSQISAFGAAVTMGSFKAAVAFFSDEKKAAVSRSELIRAMYYIIHGEWKDEKAILKEILAITDRNRHKNIQNDFIQASIALKLAMNAFELVPAKKSSDKEVKTDAQPEPAVS